MTKKCMSNADRLAEIDRVIDRHEAYLFDLPGVHGMGIGEKDGKLAIKVFVTPGTDISQTIPAELEGYPVDVEFMPEFWAG